MSTSLRKRLDDLAYTFTTGVLHAVRSASIEDVLAESGGGRRAPVRAVAATGEGDGAEPRAARGKGGRLPRRSAADIGELIDQIVALVKQSPGGLRAEQIRQKLDLQAKEMPRPLKEAVEAGRLGKSGQKRATTYFAKGAGAAARPARASKPARKAASSRTAKKAKQAKQAKRAKKARPAKKASK
jgi:hypothetical protein